MTNILPFINAGLRVLCGFCRKPMRRVHAGNEPAYCSYDCGCAGQPEHVLAMWERGMRG